jgi:hypothetical protein
MYAVHFSRFVMTTIICVNRIVIIIVVVGLWAVALSRK